MLLPLVDLKVYTGDELPYFSDKAIFPPSLLTRVVEAYGEKSLPHPLIFRVGKGDRSYYVGVREFSAEEGTVRLPGSFVEKVFIKEDFLSFQLADDVPKGKYLTLKPLQFYPQITNWKYYLENRLSRYYTTLTVHDMLHIEDNNTIFELFIEDVGDSGDTICIIDTDMILDIIPLNDIMATQQLEFSKFSLMNSLENTKEIRVGEIVHLNNMKPFSSQDYVPSLFKIDLSQFHNQDMLNIIIRNSGPHLQIDQIVNMDCLVGLDKLTNMENFKWSTMDDDFEIQYRLDHNLIETPVKSINIKIAESGELLTKVNQKKGDDESADSHIYIAPFVWEFQANIDLEVSTSNAAIPDVQNPKELIAEEEEERYRCPNCEKEIPKRTRQLHEPFCLRNNVKCSCGCIFFKQIPPNHWHCDDCNDSKAYGNSALLLMKHRKLNHDGNYICNSCASNEKYAKYTELVVQHKSSKCSEKLHVCRFCHLVVPQGEATYQDNFLNLSHHENECGNKTTECFQCGRILRTKDVSKHLKMHTLDKLEKNNDIKLNFSKCLNENCVMITHPDANAFGLCDLCYGPVYIAQEDPNNLKLQSRIERKYMLQLTKGCGFSWCRNINCRTYNKDKFSKMSHKEIYTYLCQELFSYIASPPLPINQDRVTHSPNRLWFCVNEAIQSRTNIANVLLDVGEYSPLLIYKAVNETEANLPSAEKWLSENAIKDK